MGCKHSYTCEVSSEKCIRRLSTDLLSTHRQKKKKKLLNIKRPICLVLNQVSLEPAALENFSPSHSHGLPLPNTPSGGKLGSFTEVTSILPGQL